MSNNRIEVQHLSPDEFERVVRRQVDRAFKDHIKHIEDLQRLLLEARGVLDSKGVKEYLNISDDALRRYETELGLPFHRPGGKIKLYLVDEIKEWIRKHPAHIA